MHRFHSKVQGVDHRSASNAANSVDWARGKPETARKPADDNAPVELLQTRKPLASHPYLLDPFEATIDESVPTDDVSMDARHCKALLRAALPSRQVLERSQKCKGRKICLPHLSRHLQDGNMIPGEVRTVRAEAVVIRLRLAVLACLNRCWLGSGVCRYPKPFHQQIMRGSAPSTSP